MSDAHDDAGRFQPPAPLNDATEPVVEPHDAPQASAPVEAHEPTAEGQTESLPTSTVPDQPAESQAEAQVAEPTVQNTAQDTEVLALGDHTQTIETQPTAASGTLGGATGDAAYGTSAFTAPGQQPATGAPQVGPQPQPQGQPQPGSPLWSFEQPLPVAGVTPAPAADGGSGEPPTQTPAKAPRKGPGWRGVIGVATLLSLVSALVGGGIGAYLANAGRLTFGNSSYEAPAAQPGASERPAGSVASIAATALPSVVTIEVDGAEGEGTGSGWVFDTAGHIVTNNHVVQGADNDTVTVVLSNGNKIDATIVGADASYDLAVIKVTDSSLKPLPIGTSADVVVGDPVIAVGAPLGLESTVTTGIISALNRPVSVGGGSGQSFINALQTDAAINPGNSGGPLLNMSGQVIGVNSAIAQVPSAGSSASGSIGVGFSIPADQVRKTAEQLIRTGKAEHPIIGVILDRTYSGEGVKVSSDGNAVTPDGPADKAGLKPGDVIVAFEGRPVVGPDEFVVGIRAKSVGDTVTLKVRRDGKDFDAKMTLQGSSG